MLQALIGPVTSLVGKFIKDKDVFKRNGKLARFLLQRGYEFDIIWNQINKNKIKNE